jgi:hypothetical protein|uniref:Uncharacterized protein n=3 Tax=unclassified Caudoviricetes TaxID=2788787 RepID=A0A8S5NID8_9CAUD|nr:MAG TPA: hypothetical protein [Siphoviridae sp. ctUF252]DAE01549.1 MAG TPA: hypothetical protein [Siphoviridae sp. ctZHt25]DAE92231.1 MAG TPA: hypothetical protein [Siphoviridae sp. ctES717]
MSNEVYGYSGFEAMSEILEKYIDGADNAVDVLETGAKEFVGDLLKLPKPISKIRKSGYTHLIKCFAYKKKNKEVEAGWGKYYGPMLEHGTVKMNAQEHLYPVWDRNKEKYYKKMLTKLGIKTW